MAAARGFVPARGGLWVTPVAWLPGRPNAQRRMALPPAPHDMPDASGGFYHTSYSSRGLGLNQGIAQARNQWAAASGENFGAYDAEARGPGATRALFVANFLTAHAMQQQDDPGAHLHRHYWKFGGALGAAPAAVGWLGGYYRKYGPNRVLRSRMFRAANVRQATLANGRPDPTKYFVASQRKFGTYYRVKIVRPRGRDRPRRRNTRQPATYYLCTCPDWAKWNAGWYGAVMRPPRRPGQRQADRMIQTAGSQGSRRHLNRGFRHCKHSLCVHRLTTAGAAIRTITQGETHLMGNMQQRTRLPRPPPPAPEPAPAPALPADDTATGGVLFPGADDPFDPYEGELPDFLGLFGSGDFDPTDVTPGTPFGDDPDFGVPMAEDDGGLPAPGLGFAARAAAAIAPPPLPPGPGVYIPQPGGRAFFAPRPGRPLHPRRRGRGRVRDPVQVPGPQPGLQLGMPPIGFAGQFGGRAAPAPGFGGQGPPLDMFGQPIAQVPFGQANVGRQPPVYTGFGGLDPMDPFGGEDPFAGDDPFM